jgi:hypothetical protein
LPVSSDQFAIPIIEIVVGDDQGGDRYVNNRKAPRNEDLVFLKGMPQVRLKEYN